MQEIIARVPQGSILELLLFNLILNDIFLFVSNSKLSKFGDDNTLYATGYNLNVAKKVSFNDFNIVTELFYETQVTVTLCALEKILRMKLWP